MVCCCFDELNNDRTSRRLHFYNRFTTFTIDLQHFTPYILLNDPNLQWFYNIPFSRSFTQSFTTAYNNMSNNQRKASDNGKQDDDVQIDVDDYDDQSISGWSIPNNEEHLGEKRTRSSDYHLAIRPCKGHQCFDKVSQ